MSYSMMEALFDGSYIPWERRNTSSPERRGLEEKTEKEKQYFMTKMSLDDCKRFQDLENLLAQSAFDEEVDIYSHGFILGTLLMLEVMEKKEKIIRS